MIDVAANRHCRPVAWWLLLGMLGVGYALALSRGSLGAASVPVLTALLAAGAAVRQPRLAGQVMGHAAFVVLGAGLALHLLPGFHNALVLLTPATQWHALTSFHLNLDKPLIGFWLLLACPWIVTRHRAWPAIGTTLVAAPLTLIACGCAALLLGLVHWLPGWSPQTDLWLANNLLLVCVTEELLFRGYLQGSLARRWPTRPGRAILVSAVLFGLAHGMGGWPWVAVATLAGLGYGWACHRGGLLAAVAVHFGVNVVHFGAFTYAVRA